MRRSLPLLLTGTLLIAACSKKAQPNNNNGNTVTVIPPPTPAGTVTTVAGNAIPGVVNAKGTAASFYDPTGLAVDAYDYVSVADQQNSLIRTISPYDVVSTLAGNGVDSLANGNGTAASFNFPAGIAIDSKGNLYVADTGNDLIRMITSSGVVSTFAGGGPLGAVNGTGAAASFNAPVGVAIDASGNIYVADAGNNLIREITPAGLVSTLAGSGAATFANGTGTAASFNFPNGVAVDASGNVYVADMQNRLIRKITQAGVVTTFAGGSGGVAINFKAPAGIAVDASGNVYVADEGTNLISKITPAGVASTLAGSGATGFTNAVGTAASFNFPTGVAVDSHGNVYVADRGNNAIREISSGQ
jgi:sugar lactone lactonase YvrE